MVEVVKQTEVKTEASLNSTFIRGIAEGLS